MDPLGWTFAAKWAFAADFTVHVGINNDIFEGGDSESSYYIGSKNRACTTRTNVWQVTVGMQLNLNVLALLQAMLKLQQAAVLGLTHSVATPHYTVLCSTLSR